MLAALCMAALLAASGVREAAAAAPAACSLPANANCQLTQCPCYHKQIDNANYTRPAGCVAEATPADVNITGDVEMCRYADTAFPEPGEYVPQQIHIMPASTDFTSVFIVWATGHVTETLPDLPYTTNPYNTNPLNKSAPGDAQTYVWISTYGPSVGPANATTVPSGRGGALIIADPATANAVYTSYPAGDYSSPVIHTVTVPNLMPSSSYFYKVGDPTKPNGVSAVYSFHIPCADDSTVYPFRLGCIADVGQTLNSTTTLAKLKADKPNAVLLAGDLTYADDYNADDRFGYQPRWDIWGRLTQSIFSTIPLIAGIGNHEEESEFTFGDDYTMTTGCAYPGLIGGTGGDCARSFIHRYPTPYVSAGSSSPFWYSVDVGPVHIIMLSSYNPTCNSISPTSLSCPLGKAMTSDQYEWLASDLASYKRTSYNSWLLVAFHEPYYSTEGSYGLAGYFQQNLEPLFYKYGVDIVITGHVHAYERFFPVYQGQITECAPVYFVVGDAGNEEGPDSYTNTTDATYSAFRESSFGHGMLNFVNSTTVLWNWQRNQDTAVTSDTVTITRATATNTKCANRGYVAG